MSPVTHAAKRKAETVSENRGGTFVKNKEKQLLFCSTQEESEEKEGGGREKNSILYPQLCVRINRTGIRSTVILFRFGTRTRSCRV
ncbi:hypothetical protein CEXT_54291 [Caerostris extrusa]|uniref:Uncharacterized protein n=1 Tax=Caerostris extrusa TaxID=172846 RepID=A0AAV4QQN5_CAEEX|nr:hypothetical protein CEXT_54291 [Caerostris extrusa]